MGANHKLTALVVSLVALFATLPRTALAAAPTTQKADAVLDAYAQGVEQVKAGDWSKARGMFERANKSVADNVHVLTALGYTCLAMGKENDARHALERAYKVDDSPDRTLVMNLALAQVQTGAPERAADALKAYLDRANSVDDEALDLLARALISMPDSEKGKATFADRTQDYLKFSARLEAGRPGMKRWGSSWVNANQADNYMKELIAAQKQMRGLNKKINENNKRIEKLTELVNEEVMRAAMMKRAADTSRYFSEIRSLQRDNSELDESRQKIRRTTNFPKFKKLDEIGAVTPDFDQAQHWLRAELDPTGAGKKPDAVAMNDDDEKENEPAEVESPADTDPTDVRKPTKPDGGDNEIKPKVAAKRPQVILVIDGRSSMKQKMKLVKAHAAQVMTTLGPGDQFGILSGQDKLDASMLPATADNQRKATSFLARVSPADGGASIVESVRGALANNPREIWLYVESLTPGERDAIAGMVRAQSQNVAINTLATLAPDTEAARDELAKFATQCGGACDGLPEAEQPASIFDE